MKELIKVMQKEFGENTKLAVFFHYEGDEIKTMTPLYAMPTDTPYKNAEFVRQLFAASKAIEYIAKEMAGKLLPNSKN